MAHDYTRFAAPAPHPGEHLREDYMPAYGLTAGRLAKAMGLGEARQRIERLVREQQDVTADTALRLGRVFGTTPDFWLNLQAAHDLSKAALANREAIEAIQPLRVA
ncbi:HigA family addiction module antitoxin [Phenylobacterium sp.]|jgi:addiction module HigA family antidote|uniref:HigA family addiction module antitoxin n=1 Tax=Phenylobacterium sp. TaxID=1871053 RepID=UPI0035AFE241